MRNACFVAAHAHTLSRFQQHMCLHVNPRKAFTINVCVTACLLRYSLRRGPQIYCLAVEQVHWQLARVRGACLLRQPRVEAQPL